MISVVSHAGWLMSASVGDQRVGMPLPKRLLRLTAPTDTHELLHGGIHALAGYAVAAGCQRALILKGGTGKEALGRVRLLRNRAVTPR